LGLTGFLPDTYEFQTVERPKSEKDSGKGKISTPRTDQTEQILLNYPCKVTPELTTNYCEENEFKRHFYRSFIVPKNIASYSPVFVDVSYTESNQRNLLMVNLAPLYGERVVISTIAIDWEFHEELLVNIIRYITEGVPKVAFIDKANKRHGDFDFLLTSARLSKISHEIYHNVAEIKPGLLNVHNTFIFSPDWQEKDIRPFLQMIRASSNDDARGKKVYRRVYYFKIVDDTLTLTQYSNFSSIDLVIDSSVLWLSSKFVGEMWGSSFWITYDVVLMMSDIGVNVSPYIEAIVKDIKKHFVEYSYDGVIGATCGMLELFVILKHRYPKEFKKTGFTNPDIQGITDWIFARFDSLSTFDQQTVILTLSRINEAGYYQGKLDQNGKYRKFSTEVLLSFNLENLPNLSEMDICRGISLCLLSDDREAEITELLLELQRVQSPSGRWTNIGRTAHVVVFLISNISKIKNILADRTNIDDTIYNGILYLRSEFNAEGSNWNNEIQATANAIHAIGLHNRLYKYSTQDFFKTLEIESDKMYAATVLHNVNESIRALRLESNQMIAQIEMAKRKAVDYQQEIDKSKLAIQQYELFEDENIEDVKRMRMAASICLLFFTVVVAYLGFKYPKRIFEELGKLDYFGVILGVVLALFFTYVAQRTALKSEILTRKKKKEEAESDFETLNL
jgi:hypothetical protein